MKGWPTLQQAHFLAPVALCSLLLMLCPTVSPAQTPHLTTAQWEADLQFLVAQMRARHVSLFHQTPEGTFGAAVDRLASRLGELDDDQIVVEFAKIATMAGDGHSGILWFPPGDTYYPLRLRYFENELYLDSTTKQNGSLVGARLIGVDRTSSAELLRLMSGVIPHDPENLGLVLRYAPTLIVSSNVLHGLGVTNTSGEATFHFEKGGSVFDVTLQPEAALTTLFGNIEFVGRVYSRIPGWIDARKDGPVPLWLQSNDRNWATYIPTSNVEYVQFNRVLDGSDETLADFFASVFASIDRYHPEKLILDLRLNNGGNNTLLTPLLAGIRERAPINRRPHLFVIIGPTTYSAAQNFVNRLQLAAQPIFVGEPTGENVNSYGDPSVFELPNSHIAFGMSTRYWQDLPGDARIATAPDLPAPMSIDDYINNRDPAMDAILHYH
jgi:hypothetical protein